MQRIGKALMLPVAILPAAGLLLAIGTAFQGEALQHYLPFINDIVQQIANMLTGAGGIIFDNLPIIFALGVNWSCRWRWCSCYCCICWFYHFK